MITKLVCKDLSVLLAPCQTLGPKRTFCPSSGNPAPTLYPFPAPSCSLLAANPHWLQGVAQPLMKINCNQCASWAAINCTKSSRVEPRRVESAKWKWAKETATATGRRLPARPTENWELTEENWELGTVLVAVGCGTVASSGSQVHETPRDDDGNLIAIYMANAEWHLLPAQTGPGQSWGRDGTGATSSSRAGTGHLPLCWWHNAADELQLLRCAALRVANLLLPRYCLTKDLSQFINANPSPSSPLPKSTVCCIINIICVGQKSVPWMDRWSGLFPLNS